MKLTRHTSLFLMAAAGMVATRGMGQGMGHYPTNEQGQTLQNNAQVDEADPVPYKVLKMSQTMGTGRIDYVTADNQERRLYVPRGNQILVFNMDNLNQIGAISNATAHGVATDPSTGRGFCSSSPVVVWDTKTLETITNIAVQGRPDGILYEPYSHKIFVFSHATPNLTVIDPKTEKVTATMDLGGQPEQAASDGKGTVYVDLEDKDSVAAVDVDSMKVTTTYRLQGGGGPGGLGLDAKHHLLYVMCHDPSVCVIVSTLDGRTVKTVPIAEGTDGGGFNPNTMEAFSSGGSGALTIIKDRGMMNFEAVQDVQTRPGAKTCTLDTENNHIILIATERPPGGGAATGGDQQGGGRRGGGGPGYLDIIVVGR